jgi:hypothetical protein
VLINELENAKGMSLTGEQESDKEEAVYCSVVSNSLVILTFRIFFLVMKKSQGIAASLLMILDIGPSNILPTSRTTMGLSVFGELIVNCNQISRRSQLRISRQV